MYLRDVLSTQAERYPDIMAPMPTSVDILLVRVRVYFTQSYVSYVFLHGSLFLSSLGLSGELQKMHCFHIYTQYHTRSD